MKKQILAVLAGVMLSASVAMAAAPAAPVLSVVSGKIADGLSRAHGGSVIAADGTKMYSSFIHDNSIMMVKSSDGGVKWGGSHLIAANQNGQLELTGIAVSTDQVTPTKKIVNVVWDVISPDGNYETSDIYYSWADATDLDTWSTPIRLNGTVPYLRDATIAVSKNGKIFIKGESNDKQLYLTTSTSYTAGIFTEPTLIPVSNVGPMAGDAEIFADSSNNVHLSYPYYSDVNRTLAGIKYTKLLSGSSTWSTPVTVFAPATVGVDNSNHSGLAAFDANNIYISTIQNGNLTFFSSANGGTSWTKKVVFTKTSTLKTFGYSDIVVNSSKALTIGGVFYRTASDGTELGSDAKIYRSTDNGVTWSVATTIPNVGNFIGLGLDGNGKLGVITVSSTEFLLDGGWATYFSKEK